MGAGSICIDFSGEGYHVLELLICVSVVTTIANGWPPYGKHSSVTLSQMCESKYHSNKYRLYYKHEWDKRFTRRVRSTSGVMTYLTSGRSITDLYHYVTLQTFPDN